ncbi:hypothetical protein A2U01_0071643, partial [Trifolium medium]|nr:hypothetical protein [Trifolium medium]
DDEATESISSDVKRIVSGAKIRLETKCFDVPFVLGFRLRMNGSQGLVRLL